MQKLLFLLIFSLNIVFLNAQIVFSEPLDLSITSKMDYCLLRVDTTSLIISDEDYNGILNSDETLYVVFKLKSIGTQVKYCIKFISEKQLKVNSTFIIHNKKYLCEKLEYQISAKGTEKLVTGYFYELEE